MAVRDITYLKSRFENLDKPIETDFIDLFDTLFAGTIWSQPLIVQLSGSILVDSGDPQNALKFQIDCSTYPDFSILEFQADSTVSTTGWKFWDGDEFYDFDPDGFLQPAHQDSDVGLVTYTYSGGNRGDVYYLRYRSGTASVWGDYVAKKVVLG